MLQVLIERKWKRKRKSERGKEEKTERVENRNRTRTFFEILENGLTSFGEKDETHSVKLRECSFFFSSSFLFLSHFLQELEFKILREREREGGRKEGRKREEIKIKKKERKRKRGKEKERDCQILCKQWLKNSAISNCIDWKWIGTAIERENDNEREEREREWKRREREWKRRESKKEENIWSV